MKDTWTTHGTSIVSNGWTNVKRQPLINVVASNSSGSMFMYAKDFTGQEKTGTNIVEFLLESIKEVRFSNVLQVVTDNTSYYDYVKMKEVLVSRWEKMNITMHCLGFALNPFFSFTILNIYLNPEALNGVARRTPNQDQEVVARVLKG
ncbi:hypothetical protein V6N12_009895 [Hibiscus sabdariffa]|uniref:DUF659 domain-containing protein n=1 Tax=Hibiscus sabdariffa TaxID=183260 RepID=A0ABR2EDK4_9ROSI